MLELRNGRSVTKMLSRDFKKLEENTWISPSIDDKISVKKVTIKEEKQPERNLAEIYIPDDICCHIMQWLDGMFVIQCCFLISRQWYSVATTNQGMIFSIKIPSETNIHKLMKESWSSRVHSIELYKECDDGVISMIAPLSNLKRLVVQRNNLSFVGYETISNSFNLTELDVRKSSICRKGIEQISKLINLTQLRIKIIEDARFIVSLTNLRYLDVKNCNSDILQYLPQLDKLTYLKLGRQISFREISSTYLNEIVKLKNLKILKVYGIKRMHEIELSSLKQLTSLGVVYCNLENLQEITKLENIVNLNIDSNFIGDAFIALLKTMKKVKILDIRSNEIGIEGVKSICEMKQLTCLKIGHNNIGADGFDLLARNLKNLTDLRVNLCNIEMGVRSITELTKLTCLDIRCNKIGFLGVSLISSMKNLRILKVNDSLKERDVECLSSMKNLNSLNVAFCSLDTSDVVQISTMKNITKLNIKYNYFELKAVKALTKMPNLTNLTISLVSDDYDKGMAILSKKKFSYLNCFSFGDS